MKTFHRPALPSPGEISKEEVAAIVGEKKMTALKAEYEHPDLRCL
jgi:hypothetical protein